MWRKTFWQNKETPPGKPNPEGFPHLLRKLASRDPIIVGREGVAFTNPTTSEAQGFLKYYSGCHVIIQHCPLNKISLQIISEMNCGTVSLKKVRVEPSKLANAIKISTAYKVCLLEDPNEIRPLLRALTRADVILPRIQLCPVSQAGFKLVSRFTTWSNVTKLDLKLDERDEINVRRVFRLISALDQLKKFGYAGPLRFEDFHSLSVSEKRFDSFTCQNQTHREKSLLSKHVADVAKLDLVFINSLAVCLVRSIVALQERSGERYVLTKKRPASPFRISFRGKAADVS